MYPVLAPRLVCSYICDHFFLTTYSHVLLITSETSEIIGDKQLIDE